MASRRKKKRSQGAQRKERRQRPAVGSAPSGGTPPDKSPRPATMKAGPVAADGAKLTGIPEGPASIRAIVEQLCRINDPMMLYLLEMLIDRIADFAVVHERHKMELAGLAVH